MAQILDLPGFPAPTMDVVSKDYDSYRGSGIPIVIDHGSWRTRAGWANEEDPRLVFPSVIAKGRSKKDNSLQTFVGNEIVLADLWKLSLRTAYESGAVCNVDALEATLDHVFSRLGLDETRVNHPVLLTEPLCNPNYSRKLVNELFFECYNVDGAGYGIDSEFSFHHNVAPNRRSKALIISSGYQSTHVIPVVDSKFVLTQAKRINLGGMNAIGYLQKTLQLKYPGLAKNITYWNSEQLYQQQCFYSRSFVDDLRAIEKDDGAFRKFDRVVQFPFTPDTLAERTEEEKQQLANTRKAQGMRLKERIDRKREEKIKDQEKEIQELRELKKAKKEAEDEEDYEETLRARGFQSEKQLDDLIATIDAKLKKMKNKMAGIQEVEEPKEAPSFPLVDIPDSQLTPEQLKEKRKQKLIKAGYDARIRQKQEKETQKVKEDEESRLDEERRLANPEQWLEELRAKRLELMEKIKERKKLKDQLADRRSAASQMRMKNITALADDADLEPLTGPKVKRRRKRKADGETLFNRLKKKKKKKKRKKK